MDIDIDIDISEHLGSEDGDAVRVKRKNCRWVTVRLCKGGHALPRKRKIEKVLKCTRRLLSHQCWDRTAAISWKDSVSTQKLLESDYWI